MKRSEINAALREMEDFCQKLQYPLPPFCSFTPEAWRSLGPEYDEVRDCGLGWDITDYGQGDFSRFGFSLITLRNGSRDMPENTPRSTRKSSSTCGRDNTRPTTSTGRKARISSTGAEARF